MRKLVKSQFDSSQFVMMLFGCFLLAFTYYHINFQNGLSEGSFVGIALLGKYLFDLPPALTMLVLDIPIFILAVFLKGRKFIVNSLLASLLFTMFYELCERFSPFTLNLQHNLPLVALLSGLLSGIGVGVVLRSGSATGGDEIMALIISQWSGIKIGSVFMLMDALVLTISLIYLPFAQTMYTIMAVIISGQVITWVVNFGATKQRHIPYHMKKKTARA
ncbi:YitT family protein [Paenibacillus turicensis]|uniref:YitT family protein n=1 Tax=Paenibacillus turicensis TaxID=160487 RepID=UPI003D2D2DE6